MRNLVRLVFGTLTLAFSCLIAPIATEAWAQGGPETNDHEALASGAIRSTVNYAIPEIHLVRADGKAVSLPDELNDGRPVIMNFIFTTCTTICPLSSTTFQKLQSMLGADRKRVHLVSISIDPEEDTPARLTEYAKQYKAGPGWSFYSGTVDASLTTQRAFDAYRGDKMNHTPVVLFRPAPGKPWVRIDGFATVEELYREIVQDAGLGSK